ncbi:hypothetical protein Ancab_012120 [Ancistrocladus abbreviatus]
MDKAEDDARYPPNSYGVNNQQGYGSLQRQKLPVRNATYPRPLGNQYPDEEDDEEDELGEEEAEGNGVHCVGIVGKDNYVDEDDEDDDEDDDDDDDDDLDDGGNYGRGTGDGAVGRHAKKRKLKNLISNYEFVPRLRAPSVAAAASSARPSFGGRNSLADWTEPETFVLLDAWGDRFLQLGRKSLRLEEWQEVAEKVSQGSKIERTDTQCRNRLDTLKKKYKKEKMRLTENRGGTSKWVYFKKMDMLMSSPAQQAGLSCGMDSGEYVFMNPRVYLNRANGLDEMRDSPGNSESSKGEDDDSEGPPPNRKRKKEKTRQGSSFQLLADSIQKFSEIYEKIESKKRQQMLELEKMRMDFQREMEMQSREILERAQAEIAKIRRGDDEENDASAENVLETSA